MKTIVNGKDVSHLMIGNREAATGDAIWIDAGGDSLRLIAMHAELSRMLSITLTIDHLFEHPTIASLAKWIEGERLVSPARESLRERVRKQHDSLRRQREAQAGS